MKILRNQDGGDGGGAAPTSLLSSSGGTGETPTTQTTGSGDTTVVEPFFQNWLSPDGKFADKGWVDRLPDHLQPYKGTFSKYESVDALLNGMGNLTKLAVKKNLEPLAEDAPEEVVNERRELLRKLNGVPDDAKGYNITRPDDIPEEAWSDERMSKYAEILHKHNASPDLVKELVELNRADALAEVNQFKEGAVKQLEDERAKLKDAWGQDYDNRLRDANRAAATLGIDVNDPALQHASVVQALAKVTDLVSENKLVSGDSDPAYGQTDREKALDIVNNPANPLHKAYHDSNDPMHGKAVETRSRFNERWHQQQRRKMAA